MATEQESVDLIDEYVVKQFSRAVIIAALLGATAYLTIPIPGIPITLQTFVVYVAGVFLGPIWGAIAIILYLVTGAVGAPVFSGGGAGLGHLFGPTGGFLFAFPIAAFLIGIGVHRGTKLQNPSTVSPVVLGGILVAATAFIYIVGFSWFAWVTETNILESIALVVAPFIPGDLIKIAAVIIIVQRDILEPVYR